MKPEQYQLGSLGKPEVLCYENEHFDKKILFHYPDVFLPAVRGSTRRAAFMLDYLLERFSQVFVHVLSSSPCPDERAFDRVREGGGSVVVQVVHPNRLIVRCGHALRLASLLLKGKVPSFTSWSFLLPEVARGFAASCEKFDPDIVMVNHTPWAGMVAGLRKRPILVIDTHDVLKNIQWTYRKSSRLRDPLLWLLKGYRENIPLYHSEASILKLYDSIIAISSRDYESFIEVGLPAERIHEVSSCVSDIAEFPTASSSKKEYDLLYLAGRFLGTEIGLKFLLEDVLPQVHSRVRVAVVGQVGEYIAEAGISTPSNVELVVTGIVPETDMYYRASKIVVVPVLTGTGTSVKTDEAFARGACIVTTPAGARLRTAVDGVNCLIRCDADAFASALDQLLENEPLRHQLGSAALLQARKNVRESHRTLDNMFRGLLIH